MAIPVSLTSLHQVWAKIRHTQTVARGKHRPRLILTCEASTPTERIQTKIDYLDARVYNAEEEIGRSTIIGLDLSAHEQQIQIDVPTDHASLAIITRNAREGDITLILKLTGLAHAWHDLEMKFASQPPAGEWTRLALGSPMPDELYIYIPRSDWLKNVLEPTSHSQFVFSEIVVPRVHKPEWGSAMKHLKAAEQSFVVGNDPAVFLECRAAIDSLPGAKQAIFEAMTDEKKRDSVDNLTKVFGNYLHNGRHVAESGEKIGDFPVDHRDAEFALNTTKLLLSYASRLLE